MFLKIYNKTEVGTSSTLPPTKKNFNKFTAYCSFYNYKTSLLKLNKKKYTVRIRDVCYIIF